LGNGMHLFQVPPDSPSGIAMDPRAYPPRHGVNYNFACCDGHVESMRPSLLFSARISAVRWNNDHLLHQETW